MSMRTFKILLKLDLSKWIWSISIAYRRYICHIKPICIFPYKFITIFFLFQNYCCWPILTFFFYFSVTFLRVSSRFCFSVLFRITSKCANESIINKNDLKNKNIMSQKIYEYVEQILRWSFKMLFSLIWQLETRLCSFFNFYMNIPHIKICEIWN